MGYVLQQLIYQDKSIGNADISNMLHKQAEEKLYTTHKHCVVYQMCIQHKNTDHLLT